MTDERAEMRSFIQEFQSRLATVPRLPIIHQRNAADRARDLVRYPVLERSAARKDMDVAADFGDWMVWSLSSDAFLDTFRQHDLEYYRRVVNARDRIALERGLNEEPFGHYGVAGVLALAEVDSEDGANGLDY